MLSLYYTYSYTIVQAFHIDKINLVKHNEEEKHKYTK
jgi:hypothetical protein